MAFLNFIFQPKNELEDGGRAMAAPGIQAEVPEEPEITCPNCHKSFPESRIVSNMNVCQCGHHFRINARTRISYIADEGSFEELFREVRPKDPISFPGYEKKLESTRLASGEDEAVITGTALIKGIPCAMFVMEPYFMMGSMGTAVGEKITRIFEYATEKRLPVIGFTVSGGARMQEGLTSLMQMAKCSGAVKRHSDAGLLYITVLTDPTTGGVTASFAMEGDIILAEPGATVGFAGARVIEQTTRKVLPKGFQTAEFLMEHGFVDNIAPRRGQKKILQKVLEMHAAGGMFKRAEIKGAISEAVNGEPEEKSAYEIVKIARGNKRPTSADYISNIFTDFIELHGDRRFADDAAIIGGIAKLAGVPVTVIGIEKGRNTKERMQRAFGAPNPEGYRKALRLMKQAEKFHRPVVCLVDTSGAYCGIGAEERGQGLAIAENLMEMMTLKTPVVSVVIGEGGSGGALALAVADEVWMLENSIYSVISPEGCASILWKDSGKAAVAADVLKLTARDSLETGLIEKIIPEDKIDDRDVFFGELKVMLADKLGELNEVPLDELTENRYQRFRRIGS